MNNICMPLLNIFPLRYTGTCLIGVSYIHHHAQRTAINPFTGEFIYYNTSSYCSFSRMLLGVVSEDAIDGNKKATWSYLQYLGSYVDDIEFDMKRNNWKPITAIKLEDPDSTNPKYWSIGYTQYKHVRETNGFDPNSQYSVDLWTQEVFSVKIPDIRPALESQVPLDKFAHYQSFSKDGFITIRNEGYSSGKYMALVVVVLNFNIDLYKKDHPDLDIIYYIISNPKSINNILYTPVKRSIVC